VEKYGTAAQVTDDNIIRCMRFACWVTNATATHSEYEILTVFPRQQWVRERASVLTVYVQCRPCLCNTSNDAVRISRYPASTALG
jgi:hypothetical protein